MFAIMGITGNVGGEVARKLLAAKLPVRGVTRDAGKCAAWAQRGCEIVAADINDAATLTGAFRGAEGVLRASAAELRSVAGSSRSAGDRCDSADGARHSAPRKSCLPFDHRRAGGTTESADAAHHYRTHAGRFAGADHVSAASVVHGKL